MTAFAAAINVLFTDPNVSAAVTFTPAGGVPQSIRAIVARPDATADFLNSRIATTALEVELRVSDVTKPNAGDLVAIDGETFIVQGEPLRDPERLTWRCDLRPA